MIKDISSKQYKSFYFLNFKDPEHKGMFSFLVEFD